MTTEEIRIMLTAAQARIAELAPQQEQRWTEFKALEAELKKLSIPMEAARDAWSVIYNEINNLQRLQERYAAELPEKGGATA